MNRVLEGNRSLVLLGALLLIVLTTPLGDGDGPQSLLLVVLLFVLGLAGGYALVRNRIWFVVFSITVVLAMGLETLAGEVWPDVMSLRIVAWLVSFLSTALLIAFVLGYSLLREGVTKSDRIVAGICGYLLLGFAWSSLNLTMEALAPGSFQQATGGELVRSDFLYHSLVTLSTLGYGDIVPVGRFARMVCALEAVFGTLYLAIFISSLVGRGGRREDGAPGERID